MGDRSKKVVSVQTRLEQARYAVSRGVTSKTGLYADERCQIRVGLRAQDADEG